VELARNKERVEKMRDKLRSGKSTARLFNSELFVRDLETAYEAMYRRYEAGLPPDHIEI
jgi:predicted O-linked N-acetylglucosamine transferase (SPINDLY family)